MYKWMLAAGAAALAITSPVLAERGGQREGKGQSAQKEERSGGQAKARGGGSRQAKADRGSNRQLRTERSGGNRQVRAERTGTNRQAKADRDGDRVRSQPVRVAQRDDRDRGRGRDNVRVEARGGDRARAARVDVNRDNRGRGRDDVRTVRVNDNRGRDRDNVRDNVRTVRVDRDAVRGNGNARFVTVDGNDFVRVRDVDRRGVVRVRDIDRDGLFVRRLGYGVGGCPPGLAKKPVACLPPGQAAKLVGQPLFAATRIAALDPLPRSFNNLFWDNDDYYYRYGGGYVYRVDRDDDLIASMIPLFGAALIGQPLQPNFVNSYYTPSYFNSFYPNSPYDCYRYGFGYVYETDCATGFVEDVIPTYDNGYGVGQLMPASYGYYNLPYTYRSQFIDDDDYYYRYAPGAIYRVDRDTALISAVVALLSGGLSVGQQLPLGYGAYNVPLAYRSTYYDRPDVWYRYGNGYIYAVDPGTRMVNSVAYAIV